jgi:hypothetical protein
MIHIANGSKPGFIQNAINGLTGNNKNKESAVSGLTMTLNALLDVTKSKSSMLKQHQIKS